MIDTHCHIHSTDYPLAQADVMRRARDAGVQAILTVGADLADSRLAVELAAAEPDVWAGVGIHPHEAEKELDRLAELDELARSPKVVAIGECGLDYFYGHSHDEAQRTVLRYQLELAARLELPVSLHIRGAKDDPEKIWDDLWNLLKSVPKVTGVVHSFAAGQPQLEGVLSYGLSVGLNGILTFPGAEEAKAVAAQAPVASILFETDAPYLTPVPKRGKVNEPMNVWETIQAAAKLRGEDPDELANATTGNARQLFKFKEQVA